MNINNELEKSNLLIDYIDECWKKLITNQIDEAMKILDKIFVNIEDIANISNTENVNIYIEKYYNLFTRMEECLKIKDYILLGDILKYEIKPIIEN